MRIRSPEGELSSLVHSPGAVAPSRSILRGVPVLLLLLMPSVGSGLAGWTAPSAVEEDSLLACTVNLGPSFDIGPGGGGPVVTPLAPGIVNMSVRPAAETAGSTISVNLTVQDVNSYLDIYVVLVILYYKGKHQACGSYQRGDTASDYNGRTRFEDLMEPVGTMEPGFEDRVRDSPDPNVLATQYRLDFSFKKVASNYLTVQLWDRTLKGTVQAFEINPDLRPSSFPEPTIPWVVSGFSAVGATVALFFMRLGSNKMARIAERRAGRARAVLTASSR
ncbi:MAG TPA: hypothetical protein VI893_10485 [Thermoplasmata archaeon]|nr:hypothetical protein [Thermoplasmata archaeon]